MTEEVCVEIRRWITLYGISVTVHSDRGFPRAFAGFLEPCSTALFIHALSTPYHPQANGEVKRSNRSIGETLAKFVSSHQRDYYKSGP